MSGVVDILGVPVNGMTMSDTLKAIDDVISVRGSLDIGVVNAAKIVNMQRDKGLAAAVMGSDIILADGMSVVLASRVLGTPVPERVAGIDLMHEILRQGQEKSYRVFCLGATRQVVERVGSIFATEYPGINIVGIRDGYFSEEAESEVAQEIAQAKPDVLFVAITSPKKEKFMARWSSTLNVPVVHGVGGSFDVVAGVVKRAPVAWQKSGLEWLYRVVQEPRRLWKRYLVTNTLFVWFVFRQMFQRITPSGRRKNSELSAGRTSERR